MRDVGDFARYFIGRGVCTAGGGEDGCLRLQRMLIFANLIHLARHDCPLFDEPLTQSGGRFAIEKLRRLYESHSYPLKIESGAPLPVFCQREYETMDDTIKLFGSLSEAELEKLDETFGFMTAGCVHTSQISGPDKPAAVGRPVLKREALRMSQILAALKKTEEECGYLKCIRLCGVNFFYDPKELEPDGALCCILEDFARSADDTAYIVYMDDGKLVIY